MRIAAMITALRADFGTANKTAINEMNCSAVIVKYCSHKVLPRNFVEEPEKFTQAHIYHSSVSTQR